MNLVRAIVYDGKWWKQKDISAEIFKDIFDDYIEFRLVVNDGVGGNDFELRSPNMKEILSINTIQGTVEQALAAISPVTLTAYPITHLGEVQFVKQVPIWDYDVDVTLGNVSYGVGQNIPKALVKDIVVTSDLPSIVPGSVEHLANKCLVVVNGLVYATQVVGDRLFVLNAAREVTRSRFPHISVIDFSAIGDVTIYRPPSNKIRTRTDSTPEGNVYRSVCTIETDIDMTNRKYLFVEAGKLHILDDYCTTVHQNFVRFVVNHKKAINDVLDRHPRERRRYIADHVEGLAESEAGFDAQAYLSAGDTMLVILEHSDVYVAKEMLHRHDIPGKFSFYRAPYGIARVDNGKIFHYSIEDSRDGEYVLAGQPSEKVFPISDTVTEDSQDLVVNGDIPSVISSYRSAEVIDVYRFTDS